MTYIDHFNDASDKYASFRPYYPKALFDFLSTLVSKRARVWDCGTGNGQAAFSLAKRFQDVFATDVNRKQLDMAPKKNNVQFVCCPAEKTPFLDKTFDLITIAQALHWFDLESFYKEARRVAKPSSIIAAWCYSLGTINVKVDTVVRTLYIDILGDEYWPKERRYIDEHYRTIRFPFKKMQTPEFTIEKKLDFFSLIGYLNTWSALKEYQKRQHTNPIELIYDKLLSAWGDPKTELLMRWNLHLLVGVVD